MRVALHAGRLFFLFVQAMPSTRFPQELRTFIVEKVDSITHLEALLLLYRNRDLTLTVDWVAAQLYVDAACAGEVLSRLEGFGLVRDCGGEYRYQAGPGTDRLVWLLSQAYAESLISITDLIHAK